MNSLTIKHLYRKKMLLDAIDVMYSNPHVNEEDTSIIYMIPYFLPEDPEGYFYGMSYDIPKDFQKSTYGKYLVVDFNSSSVDYAETDNPVVFMLNLQNPDFKENVIFARRQLTDEMLSLLMRISKAEASMAMFAQLLHIKGEETASVREDIIIHLVESKLEMLDDYIVSMATMYQSAVDTVKSGDLNKLHATIDSLRTKPKEREPLRRLN